MYIIATLILVPVIFVLVLYLKMQQVKEDLVLLVIESARDQWVPKATISVREVCQHVNLKLRRMGTRDTLSPQHARRILVRFVKKGMLTHKTSDTFNILQDNIT